MLRTLTLRSLLTWLPLLLSLSSLGEGRPRLAHRGAPDAGREESQRRLILEAVKTGILSSMGMETTPPRPAEKATEQDLRRMNRLYGDKLRELRGNSSQPMNESRHSLKRTSTVLFPATVEAVKVLSVEPGRPPSDRHLQWYRAVFHHNPNLRSELTLARAQLKIYRQLLDGPRRPERTEPRQEVRVKVYVAKTLNSIEAPTHSEILLQTNVSNSNGVVVDVRGGVERWRRLGAGRSLVVDVGLAVGEGGGGPEAANPRVAIEVGLAERRRRPRRSNREDACDEQGHCCRKSVSVSFKEIGWSDWVVAPASYTMHFCDGACPHNYKPASMHTQVKSRMHQMSRGATPRPCCVPAAYEPMILMHYDSRGKLKLTPFNDLIVSRCLCA